MSIYNFELDINKMAVFESHDYPKIHMTLLKDRPDSLTSQLELNARFKEIK